MNALVTGGAGFIGSALSRKLLAEGHSVRILDNFLTGLKENVPPQAELIRGDLRDPEAVREACTGIEVVFHQGAVRSVPKSVDEPMLAETCNAQGTLNLLMAAEEAKVRRVVYASSSSAYGDRSEERNHEDMAPNPLSPYAVSKLTGEHYCRVWTRLKGLGTVSLRYFNVFGPGQRPDSQYSAVFPAFISALARNEPPVVHWDGEQSRDFTYIEDVVQANILAARAGDQADGKVINIGAGRAKSVNEVLAAVSDAMGVHIEPKRTPMRKGDVRRTYADITRAKDLLNWAPQADWRQAVQATVDWFKQKRPI